MSFALTGFEAFPVATKGATTRRAVQRVVLHITGTTADVDLDIGDDSPGTFWTDVLAQTDFNTSEIQDRFQQIIAQADSIANLYCPEIESSGVRAAAASGTAYTLVHENLRPNYGFDTNQGLTSYTIFIDYHLKNNVLPVVENYGELDY